MVCSMIHSGARARLAARAFTCASLLLIVHPARGQEKTFIRLIVPETDTVQTASSTYRLSACTAPGSALSLNGRSLKVYSSGGCAGLLDLAVGENPFTLSAAGPGVARASKTFLVVRTPPPQSSPETPVQIDTMMMEPSRELWLAEGDRLEVQFKGSPGCTASCDLGIAMSELPAGEAGTLRGIYRGSYTVRAADTLSLRRITFTLRSPAGDSAVAASRARVSYRNDFPLVGLTQGDRPALAYGIGEDRLGGAKMSVIGSGIRLAIAGRNGPLYKVALAPAREAWISTENVELLPKNARPPSAITENFTVYGDDKFDYVTVNVPAKLPWASSTEANPSRIHVDLFGAMVNSNWIIQQLNTREITNVSYSVPSARTIRITIELRHKQIWGYEVSYNGAGLVIKVRRQPERLKIKALTFALDAGHGGSNFGALGSTGAKEKDVNLSVVRRLKAILEDRGARVVLTRDSDSDMTSADRARRVIASGADILISLHSNSCGLTSNPLDTRGTATFYKHLCYRSLTLAVLNQVLKTGLPLYGNVGSFNFALNSPTELPSVLLEMAFISNPEEEIKLLDPDFQQRIAERVVDGIDDFLDQCND